ncbi:MAG TPA: hypothetical protein VKU01_25205 [Bryobacteraceae bacterium]|nr:hypothetical protein [Bryobacteraceae bacterium]
MFAFPAVDPIPLPAPVWLMKSLLVLTFALHFATVQMLLGGLMVVPGLTLLGRGNSARAGALAIARRLPVVMTYVINFGVPPLLFAQVLYGRALYTSSVLIGFYWILVIPLLMLCYWLLYRFSARLEQGKAAWWSTGGALVVALAIARIYASNMTLMLRPEAWQSMYVAGQSGTSLPSGDPSLLWRWLFAIAGGPLFAGLWMLWLASRKTFNAADGRFFGKVGGGLVVAGAVVQFAMAAFAYSSQSGDVLQRLAVNPWYAGARFAWIAALALAVLLGLAELIKPSLGAIGSWAALAVGFLLVGGLALFRDGVRDATLAVKGFDVWQLPVATNWGVVIVFLVLFVAGIAAIGWLISVVARAKKVMESVA